jgi:hypothetical protein
MIFRKAAYVSTSISEWWEPGSINRARIVGSSSLHCPYGLAGGGSRRGYRQKEAQMATHDCNGPPTRDAAPSPTRPAIPPPGRSLDFDAWCRLLTAELRRYLPAVAATTNGRDRVTWRYGGQEVTAHNDRGCYRFS